MKLDIITGLAAGKPSYAIAAAVLALLVLALVWRAVLRVVRGKRAENVLTVIAAVIATTVQADGMWIFFRDVAHAPVLLRIECFAFLEIAMFVSGLRARQNIRETPEHAAGADGIAVWAIAALSATLASTASDSLWVILLRFTAAAVSAWLWERGLTGERRRARTGESALGRERGRINWRLTPERVLVFLGLAEAADRTAGEVDAHRRLTRVALAVQGLRTLRAADARPRRLRRAERKLDAAMRAAIEYTDLASDEGSQEALLSQIGALAHARGLAEMDVPAPWAWTTGPVTLNAEPPSHQIPGEPDDAAGALLQWLKGETVLDPAPALTEIEVHLGRAREVFGQQLAAGQIPSVRRLKAGLRVGQPRAKEVHAHLSASASN